MSYRTLPIAGAAVAGTVCGASSDREPTVGSGVFAAADPDRAEPCRRI